MSYFLDHLWLLWATGQISHSFIFNCQIQKIMPSKIIKLKGHRSSRGEDDLTGLIICSPSCLIEIFPSSNSPTIDMASRAHRSKFAFNYVNGSHSDKTLSLSSICMYLICMSMQSCFFSLLQLFSDLQVCLVIYCMHYSCFFADFGGCPCTTGRNYCLH